MGIWRRLRGNAVISHSRSCTYIGREQRNMVLLQENVGYQAKRKMSRVSEIGAL